MCQTIGDFTAGKYKSDKKPILKKCRGSSVGVWTGPREAD